MKPGERFTNWFSRQENTLLRFCALHSSLKMIIKKMCKRAFELGRRFEKEEMKKKIDDYQKRVDYLEDYCGGPRRRIDHLVKTNDELRKALRTALTLKRYEKEQRKEFVRLLQPEKEYSEETLFTDSHITSLQE